MDNYQIAKHFSFLSRLMEVHGQNSFKSKTYAIAAYKIEQLTVDLQTLSHSEIFSINGIGEAIGNKIIEILGTGKLAMLDELIAETPEEILEMMKIKGVGPKKISVIWKQMEIESVGELLYACHENRLSMMKGFGKKSQQNIIEAIEFFQKQQGRYLYAQVEQLATDIEILLKRFLGTDSICIAGDIARHSETVEEITFVTDGNVNSILEKISGLAEFELVANDPDFLLFKYNNGIKVRLFLSSPDSFVERCFEKIGSSDFIDGFNELFDTLTMKTGSATEKEIFKKSGLQFIPAYLRENGDIIRVARDFKIPKVIVPGDIKGIVHCHSTWSDGSNTLEELADACIERGYEYLVISDHSKAAFYAQGLNENQIKTQHELIDKLNQQKKPFKIFKSIESDILNDGNLDYSTGILSTFDLVIASIHSNLKMTGEKAMTRLLTAIENPYTTILGHMTGRLLLSRKGYPVDHIKIIDACAANGVVIEINAHPRRLDMRWQWIEYSLSKNVLLSIDPDAHSIGEFSNTKYGVLVAQKAMVTPQNNLSSFSLEEFEDFLQKRKHR